MPSSAYQNTVFVLDYVSRLEPASILDVGSGFGRWGFLCRCHIGGGHSLTADPAPALRIEAVEGFRRNVSPLYDAVYNRTHIGNAREVVPTLGEYDVIICGDMIEHLDKSEARQLIDAMKARSRKALILTLPLGEAPQEAIYGNDLETHRSTWHRSDFPDARLHTFRFMAGIPIAVVIWPRSEDARWLAKAMRNPLRWWATRHLGGLLQRVRRRG